MNRNKIKRILYKVMIYGLLLSLTVIVAYPFIWMILSSFKESKEFYYMPPRLLPNAFTFVNYTQLIEMWNFGTYYFNSIFVTAVQVTANLFIVTLAGYGFAKYNFRGKNFFFLLIISCTMIPWIATIIPLYIMFTGLMNTYLGLMIPGMASAFSILLARNFIAGIPTTFIEAARIDGAGEGRIFLRIVLPSIKPVLAVITINKMIQSWNAFTWPLLVVNSDSLRTLPLAIAKLSSQYYDSYDLKMAAATMTILPVLILYISLQKYFVEGVALSGVKG